MKFSRRLRSFGAVLLCSTMVVCNVPLVQAADLFIGTSVDEEDIYGNGLEPLHVNEVPVYSTGGGPPFGNPDNNNVTVRGGTNKSIHGGHADEDMYTASGNQIVVGSTNNAGGNTGANIANLYGGSVINGYANNNSIEIIHGLITDNTYGGYAEAGTANSNSVVVRGDYPGSTVNNVYGGWAELGGADDNTVTIDSRATGNIAGGYSGVVTPNTNNGTTHNNTVNIESRAVIRGDIYGGKSGSASNNTVNIYGADIQGDIIGGGDDGYFGFYTQKNTVNIYGGVIVGDVYGGKIPVTDARENKVEIKGATLSGNIYGGYTELGHVVGNEIVLDQDTSVTEGDLIGGHSRQGDALENKISMINGRFINTNGEIIGGRAFIGDANANIIDISGGEATAMDVIGGDSDLGNANGNIVRIGNTFGSFIVTTIYGGRSSSGSANNNEVHIDRGAFTDIYGGWSGGDGYATNNKVYIRGGTVNGAIFGGYSQTGFATGNLIDISSTAVLNDTVRLYGGFSETGRDARSGNTLNIRKPVTIDGLYNFEKFNFYLPADFTANQTMITVTNSTRQANDPINLKNAKIDIGVSEGSSLKQGDIVILIDEQSGVGFDGNPSNNATNGSTLVDRSGLVNYNFGLTVTDNQLRANVLGTSLDSRASSFPEGFLGGIILANQGADAIAGAAMDSALTAAHKDPVNTMGGFASLVAGKSKYNTGSSVDMTGVSVAAGLALGVNFSSSRLTVGPFAEYGKGIYDTIQGSNTEQEVIGDGDSQYMGGGFLLRIDYNDTGIGRYFAEASIRLGILDNNFSVNWQNEGEAADVLSYKTSIPYYGLHLGYGGSWDVASSVSLDIYGKYFFARGADGTALLSSGENIEFDKLTSNRIRGGARATYNSNNNLTFSFGGSYEYEISGENKAAMLGYIINAPSLKGGTGIGEFVVGYKPSSFDKLASINVGIQGYAGKRDGITGSVSIRF